MTARLFCALLPSVVVVTFLFWLMQFLISSKHYVLPEEIQKYFSLDFIQEQPKLPEMPEKRQKPEKPEKPEKPPTLPQVTHLKAPQVGETAIHMPAFQPSPLQHEGVFNLNSDGGDYLPIIKVAPQYPPRALSRGIEGDCMVEYTVTESGNVEDVRVIESLCTSGLFRAASLRATKKFRYRPRMIDGRPVRVTGVKNNFVFKIADQ